ncbi:MAG: rRNA maturation RNase YbeY [Ignavibacteria bacterium]
MKLSILYDKKDFTNFIYTKNFQKKITKLINSVSRKEKKHFVPTTIRFCDLSTIVDYNKQFLNHNYVTDIITFDYTSIGINQVDILICPEVVEGNSKRYRTNFESEMLRVIVHGFLHLCGYDDKKNSDKKIMRERENSYLKLLDINE